MNSFSFVGKIVPVKDTENFKGYTETVYDSGWMKQRLVFNLIAGTNRHTVEINAGRWKDDKKNSTIYTYSRATEGKKSEPIQIKWENRNDPKVIESVAGYRVFTVDTDTFSNRKSLEDAGDVEALKKSQAKRKHFIASSDFVEWMQKVVNSDKVKDMTFRVNGNITYSYSEKTGKYYTAYEVTKVYRVDDNAEPESGVNIEFYYPEGFIDKDGVEDYGKAILNGFTPFYDSSTKATWFAPISIVMHENNMEKVDVTEEVMSDFTDCEVCKSVLKCIAVNGAQKQDIKLEDLDEKTQRAVKHGLMSEDQAIRNAGGQLFGPKIQEIAFAELGNTGETTVYGVDILNEKPHVEEEDSDANELPFDLDSEDEEI